MAKKVQKIAASAKQCAGLYSISLDTFGKMQKSITNGFTGLKSNHFHHHVVSLFFTSVSINLLFSITLLLCIQALPSAYHRAAVIHLICLSCTKLNNTHAIRAGNKQEKTKKKKKKKQQKTMPTMNITSYQTKISQILLHSVIILFTININYWWAKIVKRSVYSNP